MGHNMSEHSYTRNEKVAPLVTFFFNFAYMGYITFFSVYLRTTLGFEPALISYLAILYPLGLVLFGPVWGRASDRRGDRKRLLLQGTFASGIVLCLLTFINAGMKWLVLPVLFSYGAFAISNQTLVIAIFVDDSGGNTAKLGVLNASVSAGNAAGGIVFGLLVDIFGVQYFGLWAGVITFVSLFLSFSLQGTAKDPPANEFTASSPPPTVKDPLSRDVRQLLFSIFFRFVGIFAVFTIASNVMAARGMDAIQIGILSSINPICQAILMIVVGKLLQKINFKTMYLLGAVLASCSLFLFAGASDFVAFVVSQVVLAVSYATLWSAVIYFLSETTTKANRGQNTGYLNTAQYSGHVGGNALFATLLLVFPPYTIPITIVAFIPLIAFAIVAIHHFQSLKQPHGE